MNFRNYALADLIYGDYDLLKINQVKHMQILEFIIIVIIKVSHQFLIISLTSPVIITPIIQETQPQMTPNVLTNTRLFSSRCTGSHFWNLVPTYDSVLSKC